MKLEVFVIIALCIFLTGLLYGCVDEEKEEENKAPTCNINANPTSGSIPLTVTFTLTASDSDGSISSWTLDANNDGAADYSGTGNPPTSRVHTYDSQGSYTAKLTVTDNEEKTGGDTITITVNEPTSENQSPTCTLSVTPSSGYVPLGVTFSMAADDSDGTITTWTIDINNDGTVDYSGTGSPSSTREHTYTSPGTYTAKLTVIDNQGASSTGTATISVTEEPSGNQSPTCVFTVNPDSGYVPLSVTFSMSASDPDGSISFWELDINNDGYHDYTGEGYPVMSLQHIYTNIGTYTAKLTVTDNQSATASYSRTITVREEPLENQVPTCTLTANPTSGAAPLTVTFVLTASDPDGSITTWSLDINNDGTSDYADSGTPPSTQQHIYKNSGTFTAILIVTDDTGATSMKNIIITVHEEQWQPQYGIRYTVHATNVIDGDTLDGMFPNGNIERVRFLGIDTPELTVGYNEPYEYGDITDLDCLASWSLEAKSLTESWIEGKDILIEFDETAGLKTGDRWLAYVYLDDGTDFCAELIKQGYARAYMEGTCSQENYYFTLQQQAMDTRIGLWSCMPIVEKGLSIVLVHYDATGPDGDNLNDEYVIIKNNGDAGESLSGWSLEDEKNHVYFFPSGFVLASQASVTIHTGSGTNTQSDLYWGHGSPVWNNDHDTAYLRDSSWTLIDSWGW